MLTSIALAVSSVVGLAAISVGSEAAPAAAVVFDAAAYPLKFNASNRVAISPAGNVGTHVNDILRYNAVTTINGVVVDAVVQVVALDSGATIQELDSEDGLDQAVTTAPPGSAQAVNDLLLTNLPTTAAASVTLEISFFEGGTYTGSGTGVPVTLANVKLNTYDIDSGGTNRQYVDFRGFQSYLTYTGASPDGISISNQADGFVRFAAATTTAATSTSGSYSWSRVQVNYDRTSEMRVRMGVIASGGGFFALDYSAGGIWTTNGTTAVTPTGGTNPNNRPPTTADVALLRATVNTSTVLTTADFPYSDLDDNALASLQVVTVPLATDATLEYFNGTSWQTVSAGFIVTAADIDLGKLRISPISPSGSFTFRVSDGLAYSAAATLSYTSPPNGQTITFANPGTRAPGATFPSAATASSGLTPTLTSSTPSVCSVSGLSIVTAALPSGVTSAVCVITASQDGNATYGRADSVTQQFSVSSLLAQTITFTDPGDREFSTTPIATGASASPSGLTVTLSSLTPSVCTTSGTTIVPVTLGVCSVRATQAGNATYAAAPPVTQTFNLLPVSQAITFAQPGDQSVTGGPLVVAPTASSGLTPALTSNTTSVCTVTGMSIAFVSAGTCTIAANQAGNGTYSAAPEVTRSFDITAAAQTITFAAPADQPITNGTLVVAPTASSGLTPALTSGTTSVCTVSGLTITLLTTGTCTITAEQAGNATYSAAPAVTRSFDITSLGQTITFAQPTDQVITGGPLVVAPTASSGLTPALSSNTTSVCTVTGMSITFLTAGTCTIAANQTGNSTYSAAPEVIRSFDITAAAQTITFAQPTDQITTGGPLVVAPTASSGLTPALSSNTTSVCTVTGMSITFLSAGTCTIAANQAGNSTYSAAPEVTRSFDITAAAQTITFAAPANQQITNGTLVVAPTASSGLTPTLASGTTGVCTVSGLTITLVTTGTCTVTADQAGNATYSAAPAVTRSFDITALGQTITFAQPDDVSFGDPALALSATTDAVGLTPTFTSSTPAVCTVSGTSVSFLTTGICTVSANQAGDATYAAAAAVTRSFRVIEITTRSLPLMRTGGAVSQQIAVAGAAGGGTWSTATPLPAGLTLDAATGMLSGTPIASFSGVLTFVYLENGVAHDADLMLDIRSAALLALSGIDPTLAGVLAVLLLVLGAAAIVISLRRRRRLA